nr:DoxX family protein [Pantoea sp. A4]
MSHSKDALAVASRFMAVGLFFASGVDKIAHYADNVQLMATNNVPAFFLPLVILLEVGGGIAIALGFLTRFTSVFMAVFSVVAGFLFYQGYSHAHLMVWLKNISCAAGFLLLCLNGSGKWSIDHLIQRRFAKA